MANQNKLRYRFYREHKYLSFMLSELERWVAKTDFRKQEQVNLLLNQLDGVEELMKSHAEWEESAIHELLRNKNLTIQSDIESDHKDHDFQFKKMHEMLNSILMSSCHHERLELGYQFYLLYRKFVGDNLIHLHHEETIIMLELQKLYSDEELRAVECATYHEMMPEHMIGMMEKLFPHMNASDREFFLNEIKNAEPEKFPETWNGVSQQIEVDERMLLVEKLSINA